MKTTWFCIAAALMFSFTFVGCGPSAPTETGEHDHDHDDHDHGHDHSHDEGPHHGAIADWGGGEMHVEFTVDHDKKEATVYILDNEVDKPAPIKAEEIELSIKDPEMVVKLQAAPQEGDPEGSASRFVGTNDGLGVVQEYEGTISGVVDGTPYTGDFKEEAHDHEGHDEHAADGHSH